MRAAMVGGVAYHAGKKSQERAGREEDQEYRLEELEAQQAQQAQPQQYAPPPPPAAASGDALVQLQKLAELKAQGILTDEEFNTQKARLLGS